MRVISHRCNINGRDISRENNPNCLLELLRLQIPCEIDVRYDKGFWLGHDKKQYKIKEELLILYRGLLYIHCKDLASLSRFNNELGLVNLNYFFNDKDDYSLTSQGQIWTNIGRKVCSNSILVDLRPNPDYNLKCWGLCVDYMR